MNQSDIWMLRIGGEVIGPLSTEDINDKIAALQVTGIDEVARPCASWYYLRDLDHFLVSLEKAAMGSNLSGSDSISSTKTSQNTMTYTAQLEDDRTMDVVDVVRMESTQPIEDDNVVLGNLANIKKEQAVLDLDKLKSKQPAKRKKKGKFFLLLLCALLAGGFFAFKGDLLKKNFKISLNPYKEAKKNWAIGNYRQALIDMKASLNKNSDLRDLKSAYISLLLFEERDYKKASQILKESANKNSSEWKNLNGIASEYSGNTALAEKLFLSSIAKDQFYVPSILNLGLISRKRKNWSLARNYFESAYSKGAASDFSSFLLAESWIKDSLAKGDLKDLNKVQIFLENNASLNTSYSYELEFLLLWVKKLQGVGISENLKQILKIDPYLPDERRENTLVLRQSFSNFEYICNDLSVSQNASSTWASVVSLCYFLAGSEKKAFGVVDSSLKLNQSDPRLIAIKSFGQDIIGKTEDASILLSEAMASDTNGEFMLPLYVQAHFCQRRGDYKCSSKFWQKIINKDVTSATAYASLSKAYFEVGAKDKFLNLRKKAGALNPHLKSYLELKYLVN